MARVEATESRLHARELDARLLRSVGLGLVWWVELVLGAALVVIGAYYLLSNLGLLTWLRGDVLWPILLILLGVGILVNRYRGGLR